MKDFLIILGAIAVLMGLFFLDDSVGIVNPNIVIGFLSAIMYSLIWVSIRLIIKLKKLQLPKMPFGSFKTRTARKMFIVPAIYFIVMFTFHIVMSIQLTPIKQEFKSITLVAQPRQFMDESVVSGVKLDYKGELDAVLAKRDAMLKKHGYIMIGKWWVTSGDADTARIVYLKDFTKLFRRGG